MKYKICLNLFGKRCSMFAVIVLLLIFSSCSESILKEVPLGFLDPSNASATVDGIKQGIAGLHADLRDKWFCENAAERDCVVRGLGADEAYFGENPSSSGCLTNYLTNLSSSSGLTSNIWNYCYTSIQKANILINAIKGSDSKIWSSEPVKNTYLAEAMFFRAFSYRILVNFYGDVPLVTEATITAKTDFVRTPKADVFKQIEDDLIYSTVNLPLPGKEAAPGRITQGAAWHLLSEIYITQSKFQLSVDAASKVINGYNYALMTKRFGTKLGHDVFGSGDVYYDLFAKENQNLKENTEAIWVIQVEPFIVGGGSYPGERYWGPRYQNVATTPDGKPATLGKFYNGAYTGINDSLGAPVAWGRPTSYVLYTIWTRSGWNTDIRNAKHNIKRTFYFDNPASIYNGKKIDFKLYKPGTRDPIQDTCRFIFPYFIKVCAPLEHLTDLAKCGTGFNHKDIYSFRLAETFLLRAEAYLGLGNKDLAAADINVIRNRAQATPVLPANVNIDYILDERARELFTEEWRYITLLRLGLLVERTRAYNDNPARPGCGIQDYNNLWPIPQTQIDLNINATLVQNPGY
jgi:hypothetical protein